MFSVGVCICLCGSFPLSIAGIIIECEITHVSKAPGQAHTIKVFPLFFWRGWGGGEGVVLVKEASPTEFPCPHYQNGRA